MMEPVLADLEQVVAKHLESKAPLDALVNAMVGTLSDFMAGLYSTPAEIEQVIGELKTAIESNVHASYIDRMGGPQKAQ